MSSLYRSILNAQGSSFASTNSFEFDGSTDFITSVTSPYSELDGQNNFTFSFWIKPTNLNNSKVVFSIGNGNADYRAQQFFVNISSTGQIFFYLTIMGYYCISNNSVISSNQWQHVLICRDENEAIGSKVRIFVNSVDVTQSENTRYWTNTTPSTTSLYIGEHTNSYNNPFLGNIDEFAIWAGQDLRNDVATIYNSGVPNNLNDNGLTAPTTWYRMGEAATHNGREWELTDQGSAGINALSQTLPAPPAQPSTDVPT